MATDLSNDDTQANYEQPYEGFYSKFYDELEQIAKDFFIVNYEDELTFNAAYNDFQTFLWNDFRKHIFLTTNGKLKELHCLFLSKLSRYKSNRIQKVFKNIVRPDFDKIDLSNLPDTYNFIKFIEEVAFIESVKEISRLLSCNNLYFEKIYDSNRFDIFEIRDYHLLAIKDYTHYEEMVLELRSKENNIEEKVNYYLGQPTNENANDFFEYLVEFYRNEERTSVKFVNILHYLKKDASKNFFIFKLKQIDYRILVEKRIGITIKKFAKSELYFEEERPIMNSLESSFLKTRMV